MFFDSITLLFTVDPNIIFLMIIFHQSYNLLFQVFQLQCYLFLFSSIWSVGRLNLLVIRLFFLKKLKDKFMIAFLVLGVDVFIQTNIVFQIFANLSQRCSIEDLIVELKMDFGAKIQVALKLSYTFFIKTSGIEQFLKGFIQHFIFTFERSKLRLDLSIWGVAKAKRFLDWGGRRRVVSDFRISVLWWEGKHLYFRLRISVFRVFGRQSQGRFFDLLSLVFEFVEQFYLTVPDAQESLSNRLRIKFVLPMITHAAIYQVKQNINLKQPSDLNNESLQQQNQMHYRQPSFRLGVLNMTISFEKPMLKAKGDSRMDHHSLRVSQINNFCQKYKDQIPRSNTIMPKKQENNSPYQKYRRNHKESIRYFREHSEEVETSKNILGFHPSVNQKAIQMQFNKDLQVQVPKTINRNIRNSHLRLSFNKRHLKSKVSPEHSYPKPQRLNFQVEKNPEKSLENVFTVRQVKTSMRTTRDKQLKHYMQLPVSRQENRISQRKSTKLGDIGDKKIRPWSPTRSPFNKDTFLSSSILEGSNYPQVEV